METTDPIPTLPIADPRIALVWRHWLAVRSGRTMPPRRAIDPTAILGALPILYMYDYLPDSGRFFCRLAGEEIQAGSGVRGVKKHLDELFPPETGAIIERRYRRVVDTPCMVYANGLMRTIVGMVMPIERLVLPLSDDGVVANGLIGATVYDRDQALHDLAARNSKLIEERFLPLPPA
ncbi:MAG: PAS domain-containing protein [Rhodospirillales bacterium]|nr:PAS domain-containing protein [Rhodospirillales bacterium]